MACLYDGDSNQNRYHRMGANVPKIQSTVTAFSGDRKNQDVGLDGLSNDREFNYPCI